MQLVDTVIGEMPVIAIRGRLDRAAAERDERGLMGRIADGRAAAVLDLHETEYIGGAGLRTLILARRRAESLRIPFVLCRPSQVVADAFEVAALDALPPLVSDLESASRALIGALRGKLAGAETLDARPR